MQKFRSVLISLMIVAVAMAVGALAVDITHLLIRVILPLPDVTLTMGETLAAIGYLLVSSLLVFTVVSWRNPAPLFSSAERTAVQSYAWGAAWGIGSLYLFLMSSNVFPHQLLVGGFLMGLGLFWLGYAVLGSDRDVLGRATMPGRLKAVFFAMFGLLRKPLSWLAILITLAPLGAAVMYVVSQEFRDGVAEFRVQQNVSVDGDWTTVPMNTQTQLLQPIMLRMEPGRPGNMLVLERAGLLYRISYPDNGAKELLVDFSDQVGAVNLENGALGFDFDPGYADQDRPFVYAYFTSFTPETQTNYLAQFDVSKPDPQARLASQNNLMKIGRPPTQYHNAGHVEFGPDGFLYLSIGELDIPEAHQTIDQSLVGGIMRIDVQNQGGDISGPITRQPENGATQGYSIPLDNPFVDRPNALGEFYALGLRNPFRFAFDRETGAIWAGDVGSTVWEEVNIIEKGGNYEFPFVEGREDQQGFAAPTEVIGTRRGPAYTYRHTAYDRSIIGGIVYRGDRWPALNGKYLFGDNYSGKFWAMPATKSEVKEVETLGQATKYAQRGFTSMMETPDGRILITVMGSSSTPNGEIVELVPTDGGAAQSVAGAGAVSAGAAAGPETLSSVEIRESYVTNCARCHGDYGYSDGPDADLLADQLGVRPTSFHDPAFKRRSRAHIRKILISGGPSVGMSELMPPWEGVLTDDEINALTDYIMAMPEGPDE